MSKIVFDDGNVKLIKHDDIFVIRYDAGAHQIELREDEISAGDANLILFDRTKIDSVLIDLQKRLLQSGIDPYQSNLGR